MIASIHFQRLFIFWHLHIFTLIVWVHSNTQFVVLLGLLVINQCGGSILRSYFIQMALEEDLTPEKYMQVLLCSVITDILETIWYYKNIFLISLQSGLTFSHAVTDLGWCVLLTGKCRISSLLYFAFDLKCFFSI